MKLYQLEMKGKQIPGYDCILVDEAQDLTPGMKCDECKEGSFHRKKNSSKNVLVCLQKTEANRMPSSGVSMYELLVPAVRVFHHSDYVHALMLSNKCQVMKFL